MKISRRLLLSSSAWLPLLIASGCESAAPSELVSVTDLQILAQQAQIARIPIMLFVSAPRCRYCHQLERDVIQPMLKNKRYPSVVSLRRFDLGLSHVIDFDGTSKDPMIIATRYKAQLTPTIVFLSPDGQQIADNIVGVAADLDQYGGMIDARINNALTKLGNPTQLIHP